MEVNIIVTALIQFADEGLGDPVAGDPLQARMQRAVQQAVKNALDRAHENGFEHDMSDICCISIDDVCVGQEVQPPHV